MVQPTNPSTPINQPYTSPMIPTSLPSPLNNPIGETTYPTPAFTMDANILSQSMYYLTTFHAPISQPGLVNQILLSVTKCLQDFYTFVSSPTNASLLIPDPTTGVAPIADKKGYSAFYAFMQGGTTINGYNVVRPMINGAALFDVNSQGQICSPAGLVLSNQSSTDLQNNQTLLNTLWDDPKTSGCVAGGFCNYALGLNDNTQQKEIFPPQPFANVCPSSYFDSTGALIPTPAPSNWPATPPYTPYPDTSQGVVGTLNAQSTGTPPLYSYYVPSPPMQPNLGYWMNMFVLCIKAVINQQTGQIPNFSTLLQTTIAACNAINSNSTFPLDLTSQVFFNLCLPSATSSVSDIENFFLGTPTDGSYSPFTTPSGTSPLSTFLFGANGNLENGWDAYGDESWIDGALEAT